MIHKRIFLFAHQVQCHRFHNVFLHLIRNQWKPYDELKKEQEKQLRKIIKFSYENVPYYHNLFNNLNISPKDIRYIEDLEKLPILTKDIIKKNWEDFKPSCISSLKYYSRATGGSTGNPLQFRLSKKDRFLGAAVLYRGWGYGGYQAGDKMVFLAGSSLDLGTKSGLITKMSEFTRNINYFSSFDLGEAEMQSYTENLNLIKPKFIRGYASSIFFYADWLDRNDLEVHAPSAIFTTAEKLYPHMRSKISDVFGCEVYDAYGLNDGGVTAFECQEQCGLHIDTERSILEIADQDGNQLGEGQGQVLATTLHNYAMPFIRYDTGDLASFQSGECSCGRKSLLIKDIVGRQKELLVTPTGQFVHGAALFNLIFYTIENSVYPDIVNRIKEFQIVQRQKEKIEIIFICDDELPSYVLDYIRSTIKNRFHEWDVEFHFSDEIKRSSGGKYKFIINEMVK